MSGRMRGDRDRGGHRDRHDRGGHGDRQDRGGHGDRQDRGGHGDRQDRGGHHGDRPDRGGHHGDRQDRGGLHGDRQDRGGLHGDREDRRPHFRDRGERDRDRGDRRRGGRGHPRDGMRDVREPERDLNRDMRGERDRPGQGPIILAKSDRTTEREKFEQQRQMDQEFPALVKDEKLDEGGVGGPGTIPGSIILKQREDSKRSESPATPTVAGIGRSIGRRDSISEKAVPKLRTAVKLIDENHTFCDSIADFLSDNNDFLVIGVLGLQNSGKSTVVNALAKLSSNEDDVFRVQTYEHQMLGEHCTNGIDVYINGRRMIFLDCQPLLSASVMDRTIQLEKKYTSEFNSTENTMEVHSLQMIGFLFSICHTVLLVQDWFVDTNLIRLIAAAEMLKPVTSSGDEQHIQEYFPHLVIVHNKAEMTDLEQDQRQEMEGFYRRVLSKSRLQWRDMAEVTEDKPLLQVMPDHEGDYSDEINTKRKISLHPSFEDAVKSLRKQVFSLKRTPLSQTRLNEKSWLSLASRTWDNIKNSSFYMEYSRLLP